MEPAEKQLTMAELAALFKQAQSVRRGAASAPVVYLQKQNDNLRTELPLLLPDNLHLPWVEEVRRSLPRPRHGVVLPPQALSCVCVCRRWAPSRTPSTSGSATRARSARCTRCRPLAHSPDAAVRAMTHARGMAWHGRTRTRTCTPWCRAPRPSCCSRRSTCRTCTRSASSRATTPTKVRCHRRCCTHRAVVLLVVLAVWWWWWWWWWWWPRLR